MCMELPIGWEKYHEKRGHFITYYGDIYPGYIYEFSEFPDRFFIIPNYYRKALTELQRSGLTLEKLNEYGHEIKDPKIITGIADENEIGINSEFPNPPIIGNQIWKQMFVFGAGASTYCVPKDIQSTDEYFNSRPPLGIELFGKEFEEIIAKYDGVEISRPSLNRFKDDVEEFLESEWTVIRDAHKPNILARHINIIYYLQELFFKVTNTAMKNFGRYNLYASFLDIIEKKLKKDEKIAFVNFNYDTILDRYLSKIFRVSLTQIDDYINSNEHPFLYFKPHGSHNWGWKFSQSTLKEIVGNAPDWLYSNQIMLNEIYYKFLENPNESVHRKSWALEEKFSINKNKIEVIPNNPQNYFPAMLIPYRDKDEFVMPYHHTLRMEQFVTSMEDLFLIGWKGNESHFNKLLKTKANQLKRIIIVNPTPEDVERNLSKYLGELEPKYTVIRIRDFEELVDSALLKN